MNNFSHFSLIIRDKYSFSKWQISAMEADYIYLLYISGLDAIANRKIYETYMHSGQIAYTGKLAQGLSSSNLSLKPLDITRVARKG
jgi:hypothetical protein